MKRLHAFSRPGMVLWLLGSLLLTLAPAAPAQAAPPSQDFFESSIQEATVNPLDNSLWVRWQDYVGAQQSLSNLSHFSKDGQLLKTFRVTVNQAFVTMTFEPGDWRYYYEEYTSPSTPTHAPPVFANLSYLDLQTGEAHKLVDAAAIPGGCAFDGSNLPAKLYYNAARKQFYLPCPRYYNTAGLPDEISRTALIDLTTGQVVKMLPFQPLALHPDGGKFYAYNAYFENDTSGFSQRFYDVVLVNDQSQGITTDKPLIQHQRTDYGYLSSFKVNSKTGLVYLTTRFCFAKCTTPQGAVFDRNGQAVVPFSEPKVMTYDWLNEANNQVYGPDTFAASFGRGELTALDGANVTGERLAQFYWNLLAIDQSRNLIYATYNYATSNQPSDMGLGILVVNGNTNSVIRFLQVRPPDPFFAEKAQPSPPGNPQGRYFTETKHTLTGKFLAYWEANGGLAQFGYPITEPFEEYNPDLGKPLTVQYFERTRLELHPELAGTFYEVQLGLLGHVFSALTGPRINLQYISGETSPVEGGLLFKETGHTVTGKFLAYWQANGGLARHGLPLTQPTSEVNPIDGKTYLVQYFERSRLERHPEFAGSQYEVLMGLLGTQSLRTRGWEV